MPSFEFEPDVFSDDKLLQSRCELPHRIYTTKVYPISSPNGSSIIVYGHEYGLRVVWSGGKPFQTSSEGSKQSQAQADGVRNDAIMILDSDDEDPPEKSQPGLDDAPRFAEEDESDSTSLHRPIIQYLDLPLGTNVIHLAFPSIQSDTSHVPFANQPPIIPQKLVMAAACSDNTIRIITLPLIPPSPASKEREELRDNVDMANAGHGRWNEQMLTIGGNTGHQDTPSGVAITFTPRRTGLNDDTEVEDGREDEEDVAQSQASLRRSAPRRGSFAEQEWDLLVASISPEMSGLLVVHKIPIINSIIGTSKEFGMAPDQVTPLQRHHLPSPATSISFNPCPSTARRHSHLMVVGSGSAVRIYECISTPSKPQKLAAGRRSSIHNLSTSEQGSWLISLYPGFESSKQSASRGLAVAESSVARRKVIVDAQWVLAGKAILVLLADGEWGVWDIEGASPENDKEGLSGEVGRRLLQGSAKTTWSLTGWLEKPVVKSTAARNLSDVNETETKSNFAPRTPHTRRMGEEMLFSGNSGQGSSHTQGGISVRRNPEMDYNAKVDETVIMWYEGVVAVIPSLWSYWKVQLQRNRHGGSGNLFKPDEEGRIIRLDGIKLYGEKISAIDLFPSRSKMGSMTQSNGGANIRGSAPGFTLPSDVLIAAEHRLIIASTAQPSPKSSLPAPRKEAQPSSDHRLLVAGELDVNGIDRVLANMGNPGPRDSKAAKRKVGFVSPS
ncbi:MAG: hypothetical protein M1837_002878 [Sclerophora amabilis]|nr:MAG: hypothetical protein M1837_002878 [Sclerophora amabilis]